MVLREEALLVYLGAPADREQPLDPVRIMKGMFLLTEDFAPLRNAYHFRAYHYGPFTPEVYRDLEHLMHEGLVAATPVAGRSWCRYQLTEAGRAEAEKLSGEAGGLAETATRVKTSVVSKSFPQLLRDIYRDHPEFAANTAAPELRPS